MNNVKRFVATAVVENVRVALGSEGPAMWRGVAAALQLTDAQRADIVTLWRAFRCAARAACVARPGLLAWRAPGPAAPLPRGAAPALAGPPPTPLSLRAARSEKLAGLVAARAEIHAAIAATMPLGTMARDFAVQFLAAQDCMDALKRNLRSEHVLIHEFLSTFYTQARRRGAASGPPACATLGRRPRRRGAL